MSNRDLNTDDSPAPWQRPLKLALVLPLFLGGAWATSSYHFADQLLNPPPKQCIVEEYLFCGPPNKVWPGASYQTISQAEHSDQSLSAWFVPAKKEAAKPKPVVVFYHGHGHDRRQGFRPAWFFYQNDFSVMLMDRVGHGQLAGRDSPKESVVRTQCYELTAAYSWATQKGKAVWLYAFSSGAIPALNCPHSFQRIILDSPLPSYEFWLRRWIGQTSTLPEDLVYLGTEWWLKALADFNLQATSPKGNPQVPVVFLHGQQDTLAPAAAALQLYNSLTVPKRRLIVAGGHAQLWRPGQAQPKLLRAAVDDFE